MPEFVIYMLCYFVYIYICTRLKKQKRETTGLTGGFELRKEFIKLGVLREMLEQNDRLG